MKQSKLNQITYKILKTQLDQTQQLIVLIEPLITVENELQKDVLSIISNFLCEYGNYTIMCYEEDYFKDLQWMLQTNQEQQIIINTETFVKQHKISLKGYENYCMRYIVSTDCNQELFDRKVMKGIKIIQQINDELKLKLNVNQNESVERLNCFVKSLNL